MRNIIFLGLMLSICLHSLAQENSRLDSARIAVMKYVNDTLVVPIYYSTNDTLLVNPKNLNAYFNSQVSPYLTSETDVSFFNTYAFANSVDGRLFVGHNFVTKTKLDYIKSMLTIGVHLDIEDGFANTFAEDEVANNLALSLKYTGFSNGYIKYYEKEKKRQTAKISRGLVEEEVTPGQRTELEIKRHFMAREVDQELKEKSEDFEKLQKEMTERIDEMSNQPNPDQSKIILLKQELDTLEAEFLEEMKETATSSFLDKEKEEFNSGKYFNSSYRQWYSFYVYVPVSNSEYNVASSFNQQAKTESFYPWEIQASVNGLHTFNKTSLFWFVRPKLENTNSIERSTLSAKDITEYLSIGTSGDTLTVGNLSSDEIYIGEYENMVQTNIAGQIGVMFKKWEKVQVQMGLAVTVDRTISNDYNPLNLQFGIPISLGGKDEDSPVNIQPILKWPDIQKSESDSDFKEKVIIGLNLSLPFGNTLY